MKIFKFKKKDYDILIKFAKRRNCGGFNCSECPLRRGGKYDTKGMGGCTVGNFHLTWGNYGECFKIMLDRSLPQGFKKYTKKERELCVN